MRSIRRGSRPSPHAPTSRRGLRASPGALERWSGKEWEHAWSPIRRLYLSFPITLEPDETRDFDLSVFGGYPGGNSSPRFRVETIDGIYRLVVTGGYWDYTRKLPWGEPVPLKHLTSGLFRIRTVGP